MRNKTDKNQSPFTIITATPNDVVMEYFGILRAEADEKIEKLVSSKS